MPSIHAMAFLYSVYYVFVFALFQKLFINKSFALVKNGVGCVRWGENGVGV